MRVSLLVALTMGAGCITDGFAPPTLTDGGDDIPMVVGDLANADAGSIGQPCTTACDCQATPGARCESGSCSMTSTPVFCCGTPGCTGKNLCQTPTGQVDQCSLDQDAAFTPPPGDAGSPPACATQACTQGVAGDVLCKLACRSSTAMCVPGSAGSGEHCAP
jgi:hypothetical protein